MTSHCTHQLLDQDLRTSCRYPIVVTWPLTTGTVVLATGTVVLATGTVVLATGTVVLATGTVVLTTGTIVEGSLFFLVVLSALTIV